MKVPKITRICIECSKPFLIKHWRKTRLCSRTCSANHRRGCKHTEETKRKMAKASKAAGVLKRLHKDPEFQKKRIKGICTKPTGPEKQMKSLLNILYPKEYKYTGNGDFIIDGLNPDFVNVNGQKKLIEVFGEAFHDPKKAFKKVPYRSSYRGRKEAFAKFGYKTLIIWDYEMKNMHEVERKIRRFHES